MSSNQSGVNKLDPRTQVLGGKFIQKVPHLLQEVLPRSLRLQVWSSSQLEFNDGCGNADATDLVMKHTSYIWFGRKQTEVVGSSCISHQPAGHQSAQMFDGWAAGWSWGQWTEAALSAARCHSGSASSDGIFVKENFTRFNSKHNVLGLRVL